MNTLIRLNGTKARTMYRQGREEAKDNLVETLSGGFLQIPTWLVYKIVDEIHARDTEPALREREVWLNISILPEQD